MDGCVPYKILRLAIVQSMGCRTPALWWEWERDVDISGGSRALWCAYSTSVYIPALSRRTTKHMTSISPQYHSKALVSSPHQTLNTKQAGSIYAEPGALKTILHKLQGCRDIIGTRRKHERQPSPALLLLPPPISSSLLWRVLVSPWHTPIAFSTLACAPLPGPLSCPGRCLY